MENIYNFLKQTLKQRNVRVDELVKKSGVSRTTMYRMMKGILKPTPAVQEMIIETLNLNEEEQQDFIKCINLIDVSENQLLARRELHKIIYNKSRDIGNDAEDIEFVVYTEKEKYLKKYDEVLKMISDASSVNQQFNLEIKLFNCTNDLYTTQILKFINSLGPLNNLRIEHLLRFSKDNPYQNVLILKSLFPLLMNSNYKALVETATTSEFSYKPVFSDMMLINYSGMNEDKNICKYMILSFENDSPFSDCLVTDNKHLYDFFLKKYKIIKKHYQNTLLRQTNLDYFNDFLLEFEESCDSYLLKPDLPYHRIPVSILKDVVSRMTDENMTSFVALLKDNLNPKYDFETTVENLWGNLKKRNDLSLEIKQVDIYTKKGLESLAKTRRLFDYFACIPDFTKDEVKAILENIQKKNADPNDKFNFYITNSDMSGNNLMFYFNLNGVIILEYINAHYLQGEINSCYLKETALTQVLVDFVENYLPENLALSQNEADKFIDYLIETYC